MIQKQVLIPDRVRRLPKCDRSWVDRRVQCQFASKLSGDAVFLYFTLVAVSDKNGLSFYSDNSLALMVRISLPALSKARQELMRDALHYKTVDAAYVESLVVQARRKASLPSPTTVQPKKRTGSTGTRYTRPRSIRPIYPRGRRCEPKKKLTKALRHKARSETTKL